MKLKKLVYASAMLFCATLFAPAQAQAQSKEQTRTYTVQPGETFLGIANRHHTTLDHLLSLNPGMQADVVKAGQEIIVPYVPGGADPAPTPAQRAAAAAKNNTATTTETKTTETATQKKAAELTSYEKSASPKKVKITYTNYTVQKKDTPYSVAKAHSISVDDLIEANPSLKNSDYKLKKGTTIRIPHKEEVEMPKYNGLKTVRMAVILPLTGNGLENKRSVEFYRGMLMGIEEVKKAGVNIVVSVYDEPAANASIADQMKQVTAGTPDVIVGPLYPTHFSDVTAASDKTTKVVVPFSSKVPQVDYRKEVYVVNTPATYEKTLTLDLFLNNFKKQTHVVMLHSDNGNKKEFCESLQRRLSSAGYDIVSLPESSTPSQISSALGGSKQGDFVLVPSCDSLETMKDMLNKVISLQAAMPNANVSLLGYASWIPYTSGEYSHQFHAADTYILTPNYFYPATTAAKQFTNNYKSRFNDDFVSATPKMAPLGYDLARGFIGGLASYGRDFTTQAPLEGTVGAEPKLQSEVQFITVGANGGYVSRSMWLVHFKKDMSITKISAQ